MPADSEYAELRARLVAIGVTNATEQDDIDAAIRSGLFSDSEIARLTARSRMGIWKRRKAIEGEGEK